MTAVSESANTRSVQSTRKEGTDELGQFFLPCGEEETVGKECPEEGLQPHLAVVASGNRNTVGINVGSHTGTLGKHDEGAGYAGHTHVLARAREPRLGSLRKKLQIADEIRVMTGKRAVPVIGFFKPSAVHIGHEDQGIARLRVKACDELLRAAHDGQGQGRLIRSRLHMTADNRHIEALRVVTHALAHSFQDVVLRGTNDVNHSERPAAHGVDIVHVGENSASSGQFGIFSAQTGKYSLCGEQEISPAAVRYGGRVVSVRNARGRERVPEGREDKINGALAAENFRAAELICQFL